MEVCQLNIQNKKAVIFIDVRNLVVCMGKFYLINLDKILDYIISEIGETIDSTDIYLIEILNSHSFKENIKVIEKYDIKIISTEITTSIKDPDDVMIKNLILEYAFKEHICKMVVVSLDGGYCQNLKIAEQKDKKIFIAGNERRNHKLKIFEYINLEIIRNFLIFQQNGKLFQSTVSINLIYPENCIEKVKEYMQQIDDLTNKIKKEQIQCSFSKKTKQEPLK